ncbi:MAG: imidazole glycerol phosphate synthase subunit HisH [Thermodesulfovibrionia bacterium]|nr:imidazole glycerol phosphate synthase subunit HisH [Thermodesulfovibrionia bacterium]MCK5512026.1 imidazole glycerol phosphate synthase subunit HisH [Thermodesulfovibrionia bacterium]
MIAIIDYGMGNLRSVEKGFLKVGVNATVTSNPEVVEKAHGVVLPGVGAFKDCMRELTNLELTDTIVRALKEGKPYLGICLGLQVLFSESEEFGRCRGLDIFKGYVKRFSNGELKIPHMGWNELNVKRNNFLLKEIPDKNYFYFVHSYYVVPEDDSIISGTTEYGLDFTSMIWKDNIYAVQFHPEKSQTAGLKILENFGKIVEAQRM